MTGSNPVPLVKTLLPKPPMVAVKGWTSGLTTVSVTRKWAALTGSAATARQQASALAISLPGIRVDLSGMNGAQPARGFTRVKAEDAEGQRIQEE